MRTLARKATFLGVMAAVVAVTVGSLALSQNVTFGAETDVGSETDVYVPDPTNAQFPQLGGTPVIPESFGPPPAAPLDDGNDAAVDADANSLPSAGSGGYLDSSQSNAQAYALAGLAIALVMSGSIAWFTARRSL